ncbi:hypothetical protein MAPG_01601 [Magnaporthiopsis poae ATCC 64411]|uniref:Uncharacterized protein n=1 Tax=Magnaporthiopsis poae (strain ATCC 64411 / 73-15) TaxID=644358 RepID=A0A0C4DP48_MAGP6|nr:hypothetical protein MAPG_01601 [Magnaporthiopsis poae ATCC 64411]
MNSSLAQQPYALRRGAVPSRRATHQSGQPRRQAPPRLRLRFRLLHTPEPAEDGVDPAPLLGPEHAPHKRLALSRGLEDAADPRDAADVGPHEDGVGELDDGHLGWGAILASMSVLLCLIATAFKRCG